MKTQHPVLVACEYSQTVSGAFRNAGIEAYSCDIIPTIGNPDWHIIADAIQVLHSRKWGLVIAHPPCTYLCATANHLINEPGRKEKREQAAAFFYEFYNYTGSPIAIENPRPLHCAGLPRYNQVIDPTQFGSKWHKRTCLWLKELPPLLPTHCISTNAKSWVKCTRGGKKRSKFFPEVAIAMVEQWSMYIE